MTTVQKPATDRPNHGRAQQNTSHHDVRLLRHTS